MTDLVTILSHSHSRLTKMWQADGTVSNYDKTQHYTVAERPVSNIGDLSALLSKLEKMPHAAVIRGKFKGEAAAAVIDEGAHKPGLARKLTALYDDVPHHWVLIEVDEWPATCDAVLDPVGAITEYMSACLPAEFQDVAYHWQLSNSAGHPDKLGTLNAHVWMWLATAATSAHLKAWAKNTPSLKLDSSVFNSVQLHYTSAPLFAEGVLNPVPVRSGLVRGMMSDEVHLDIKSASSPQGISADSYQSNSTDLAVWDDLTSLAPTMEWTLEFARDLLADIPADSDRDTWVKDLSALHHEFSGSLDALDLAVAWSETASNFAGRKDVEDRWSSFGKYSGTPMTGRWLLKRRQESNAHLKYDARAEWAKTLASSTDEFTVREKLCPQIARDTRLDELGREALAQSLLDVFKRLGTKYPIAECRKLLVEKRLGKNGAPETPEWAAPWVYVTEDDRFFRPDSEEWLTVQGFNACYNRMLPTNEDGQVTKTAAWEALNIFHIKTVTRSMYMPWATTATFVHEGVECVNTYRPSSPPVAIETMTPKGEAVVNLITRHLNLLAGGRPEVMTTMLDWMAHNVQNPGVKIRWAPLWKGVEGDGKTLMGSLMAAVMGRPNIKNVTPTVLGTDFTSWACGSALVVLEEIRLAGHSRHDILNALKPFITNDSIEVHAKGQDPRNAVNTTNYLAFTNFMDALPLTDTDRRWFVVFTPFMNTDEMEIAVKKWSPNLGAYFDALHEAIQLHPASLRRWLLDYRISPTFKPNGRAPMTAEKAIMVGLGVTEEEDAVLDILNNCDTSNAQDDTQHAIRGVTKNVFSSRCMGDALVLSDADFSLPTTKRNHLFSKMGFTKLAKKVKWDGDAHVVWTKGIRTLEPEQIRKILGKTLPENSGMAEFDEIGSDCSDLFRT